MKRLWVSPHIALFCCTLFSTLCYAADTIRVTGAVNQPGNFVWQPDVRLLNASIGAQVADDAWYQGAALLRISAVREQRRLKAGLLFDLQSAIVQTRAINREAPAELLTAWRQRVASMPLTGRVQAELNPLKQRLIDFNPLLEPGDHIIYPHRPNHVTVLGAVQRECMLDFVPARDPLDYLANCELADGADVDRLYVIQPDGKVQSIGAAYWNAEDSWAAVGALLYVPFEPVFFGNSREFNTEMATWLATQYRLTGGYGE